MEIAIYFNLVAFSALSWYNLDFRGNQVAIAYTSVVIMFILLSGPSSFMCYGTPGYLNDLLLRKLSEWSSYIVYYGDMNCLAFTYFEKIL